MPRSRRRSRRRSSNARRPRFRGRDSTHRRLFTNFLIWGSEGTGWAHDKVKITFYEILPEGPSNETSHTYKFTFETDVYHATVSHVLIYRTTKQYFYTGLDLFKNDMRLVGDINVSNTNVDTYVDTNDDVKTSISRSITFQSQYNATQLAEHVVRLWEGVSKLKEIDDKDYSMNPYIWTKEHDVDPRLEHF